MSRPRKQVVDYFPHFVSQGRTMFIIEQSYGNDGYAFWFKLLEVLASTDGHFYDMGLEENVEFLVAKTKLDEVSVTEILDKLAKLGAIDQELWKWKIIWSQNFITNLMPVYGKRSEIPNKPEFPSRKHGLSVVSGAETNECEVSGGENPQRKGKERKVEESRGKERKVEEISFVPKEPVPYQEIADLWNNIATSQPRVVTVTEPRKKKIKQTWNTLGEKLESFEDLFRNVEESDFLCGRTEKPFVCGFDWVMNQSNMTKIIEGNYRNKRKMSEAERIMQL